MIERAFAARLDAHYLLKPVESVSEQTLLVVTLHGFGANPETMLGLTARLFEGSAAIAALQGPNQFFLSTRAQDVGYGWVTNRHSAESVRLHHDMVRHVLEEAGGELGIPPQRRVLVGFSQPVGLNYRFAATHPEAIGGVIGICGGIPGDWETGNYSPVSSSVLHIARRHDEFYAPAVTEKYAERLRLRARDVEFHLLDGGHAVPSAGASIVTPWVERLLVSQRA
ncbi:MAG: hypothetical protein ABI693_15015 [Bryobacteraceae bacterium]